MPAENTVEMIVRGWMKLSYNMPSTMYTAVSAARNKRGCDDSESWKAAAAPWNVPWIVPGMRILRCASSMTRVASPSDAPGFKLNEIVTAGNCPWWATASEVVEGPKCANDDNGTCAPLLVIT